MSMRSSLTAAVFILPFIFPLLCAGEEELVGICTCASVIECEGRFASSLLPCLDHCHTHAARMGANLTDLKGCLEQHGGKFKNTLRCAEERFEDSCVKGNTNRTRIPRRDWDTLKMAILDEVNKMARRSGVGDDSRPLLVKGKKLYHCLMSCMEAASGQCVRSSSCALQLPSYVEVVLTGKKCAMENG